MGGSITWVYDATGRKLKKTGGTTIWYHDGVEKHDNGDWYVYTPEGRIASYTPDPEAVPSKPRKWQYEYNLRDHLGNTRLTVADDNGDGYIQVTGEDWSDGPLPLDYTEVLQENHYYPFGMNMEGFWREPGVPAKMEQHQFNGKELTQELDLDWNDYGARWYDAAIGRWNGVDPMADEEHNLPLTPYHFVSNNPNSNLDPDGLDWYRNNYTREVHWQQGSDDVSGHSNIGANYTIVGENHTIVHEQNVVVSVTENINSQSAYIAPVAISAGAAMEGAGAAAAGAGLTAGMVLGLVYYPTLKQMELEAHPNTYQYYTSSGTYTRWPNHLLKSSDYAGKTAEEIISKHKKGSIRREFPDELLDKTWEEITKGAKEGSKIYKKAKKLLGDNRFDK